MARRRRSGDCDGEGHLSGLMTSRLRLRRMLCLLKHHGLSAAARKVGKATLLFFDAGHMEQLMRMGNWDRADSYLQSFLPQDRSMESMDLILHLNNARIIAAVAAGGPDAAMHASTFDDQDLYQSPHTDKFRKLLHKMHADQPRSFMLWQKMAPGVVSTAMRLVANCPELKDKLQLPRDSPMPWEVTPLIGAQGYQRRRRIKAADRTPADVLSRAFLRRKRQHMIRETNASSGVIDASSTCAALNMKTEQIAPKPIFPGEHRTIECEERCTEAGRRSTLMQSLI
ncbi:unnamed protein product [Urochloa decumbens]|uniref:Uncharacterized protein n=1 Tax=Urochloa decumbens TaxID=240449 RepID=A0ABC9GXF0_9POAL